MDLNNAQEVHLSHYWNIISKRWRVAASVVTVVMLGTFLASYFSKPLYRSTIQLHIERDNPNQLTVDDLFGIAASEQDFLQTQYVLLKSRGLAQRVIDDHRLLSDPEFYPPGIKGKSAAEVTAIRDAMVGAIIGGTEVSPVRNTSLVDVSYIAPSPRLAQKVAEGIGASYIQMSIEQKLDNVRQANDFLARQIVQVKRDLEGARAQLQRYGESKDIISADDAGSITAQKLIRLNTDYTNAQNARIERETAYQAIIRADPNSVAGNDPVVVQLTQEESRLQRDYNQKLGIFKAEHPEMQQLRAQIEKTRQARTKALGAAYANAREAARTDMAAAQAREASMRGALEQERRDMMAMNVDAATYSDLRNEVETKQALLEQLTKRLSETEVTARLRGSNTSNIRWVDHAQMPTSRFNVTMKNNLQNAFPLGVILGLAAIFFLEYMDRSVKSPEELERVSGLASLGIIPAADTVAKSDLAPYGRGAGKLRAVDGPEEQGVELLPHFDSRSPISESYRAFRTSLLLASANSPKVIVITSSIAKEGKTTTSANLATVLAQMGKPVLIIDADLRRPRLQKIFRAKGSSGLVNYLATSTSIDQIVEETAVPNLSVIHSGPTPPNPSELLASDRMKQLIHEVRGRYSFVIFDSPPVLAVTDAVVLGANADGVVLCVHGGQTPRELVARSAERMRQSKIPILGALLSNLDLHQYGYAYKKSYYDYYESEEPAQTESRARKSV
jgi:capsular exopolysaccharide synthesis family protein